MSATTASSDSSSCPPSCPKCGAARTTAAACPTCGLSTERMDVFAAELEAAVPDSARTAWARARERWDDPAAHDELLRLVTLHGCYAWAATRYRQVGTDDPIAAQQLARVRKAAEAALVTSASTRPERPGPYRSTVYVLGVLVLLLLLGMAYASFVRARGGADRSTDRSMDRAPDRAPGRPVAAPPAPPTSQVR